MFMSKDMPRYVLVLSIIYVKMDSILSKHVTLQHFEALVEEHFTRRAHHILTACKAYMEGAPVGCAVDCGTTDEDCQKGSSTGFKIMLSKLFPKLVEAFSAKGINCSQLPTQEK